MSATPSDKPATHNSGGHIFGPASASIRNRLGAFMDIYMDGKIKVAEKLVAMIAIETDVNKLVDLRNKLNDVLLSADDITVLDTKINALVQMLQSNGTSFLAVKKMFVDAAREERSSNH